MAFAHRRTKHKAAEVGLKATLIGICINIVLAIIKGLAGYFGNSYALIADAIESTADIFTSMIVWYGLKVATRAPDIEHPYGHGKAEPMATVLVALFLLGAALLIIIQSVDKILTPHAIPSLFTLPTLVIVVIIKEILFRYVNKVGKSIESSVVKADAWHHRSDAITSATAFVGISIALIWGKGYESADDWAALIASGIIIFNAFRILRPAVNEIMDAAPPSRIMEEIRGVALGVEGVKNVEKSFIRKMGLEYFVDLHVVVGGDLSVKEGHTIAHNVKDAILASNPQINDVLIHIEPDSL